MDEERGGEDPLFQTDNFRIYEYKVKRCSRSRPHDWTQCCFAHNGEKAKRRDPRKFAYTGAACPDYRKSASCRRGDQCPFSHGVFESWLHPSRYRTQCCTDGLACKRRVCFFAHQESELRKPEDDPEVLAAQLQAEAIASQQSYQQILAAASLESVPEAHHSPATPQLNLALIQALLQSANAGAAPHALLGLPDADVQERARMHQLQALLAALQMRAAPAPPPPQAPAPQQQQQQQHNDALSSLDTAALGRLLAANQALVQQQAEQEILQRNSFEAARRSSLSSSSNSDHSGGMPYNIEALMGGSGFPRQRSGVVGSSSMQDQQPLHFRRMSLDNMGTYHQANLPGMDPGLLAALSAAPQPGGGAAHASAAAASEAGGGGCFRRSVDMGTLAHSAGGAGRPGARSNLGGFQQPAPLSGADRQDPGQDAGAGMPPELAAAYGEGLLRCGSQLDGSGQAPGQESYQYGGVPSAMDQAAALSMFQQQQHHHQGGQDAFGAFGGAPQAEPGRYAAELGGRHSGQLPGAYRQDALSGHPSYNQLLRQASSGGGAYPTYGDLHAQGSGHLGNNGYGQAGHPPAAGAFGMGANDKQSVSSASSSLGYAAEHPAGAFAAASWQDAILSGGTSLREEECRSWGARSGSPAEELAAPPASAGAGAFPPGQRPQAAYEISPRTPSNHGGGLGIPHSQPSPIPEDQPAAWSGQPPTALIEAYSQGQHAGPRPMPTLLEHLQYFTAQRQSQAGAQQQQPPPPPPPLSHFKISRNTSFESLSAELPRSISDLNLSEHHAAASRAPTAVPASTT